MHYKTYILNAEEKDDLEKASLPLNMSKYNIRSIVSSS